MKRILLMLCVFTFLGSTGQAQPISAEITFYHRTKKAQDTVKGTIVEETPGQIAYQISGRIEKVFASDVLEVEYYPTSALLKAEVRKVQKLEDEVEKAEGDARKKAVQKAIEGFTELQKQFTDSRFPQRHIAYKIARLQTRLAEDDATERPKAILAMSKFMQEHGAGWQVSKAAKILAQLQLEDGDFAGAQKTFKSLADKPDLPKETRQEYQLLSARALMRSNRFGEAQSELKAIDDLLLPDDTLMKTRVGILRAGCQGAAGDVAGAEKQLRAVLDGNADPTMKALACNTLGDIFLKAGRGEDAFWRFLMVDLLYFQDVEEHARALYHLSRLFDKVKKDPTRAQQCRERLVKEKQFIGVEYRQLALKEK